MSGRYRKRLKKLEQALTPEAGIAFVPLYFGEDEVAAIARFLAENPDFNADDPRTLWVFLVRFSRGGEDDDRRPDESRPTDL